MVSFVILALFGPRVKNIYILNLFSTLGPKRRRNRSVRTIAIFFVYHNLTKKHGLQKSLGGGGQHITPGPWTINQAGKMINKQYQTR